MSAGGAAVDGNFFERRVSGVNYIAGNTHGGHARNTAVRVFSPGIPTHAPTAEMRRVLYGGGELDVPARQLARYVDRTADRYEKVHRPVPVGFRASWSAGVDSFIARGAGTSKLR